MCEREWMWSKMIYCAERKEITRKHGFVAGPQSGWAMLQSILKHNFWIVMCNSVCKDLASYFSRFNNFVATFSAASYEKLDLQ